MSEKRKRSKSRAASLSPSHNSATLEATVQHLERQLKERDNQIAQLEERICNQEELLQHRLQCMERLKKERDELRKTNAVLIGKTAELSRKQSIAGSQNGSPVRMGRAHTLRPGLPNLPALPPQHTSSPKHKTLKESTANSLTPSIPPTDDSETDYSDMEEEEGTLIKIPQHKGGNSNSLNSSSGSSVPVVAENHVHAMAAEGSPVSNHAHTNQMGNRNSGTESTESPSLLIKRTGSGAIAQHLKHILNKKQSEKAIQQMLPKERQLEDSWENVPTPPLASNKENIDTRASIKSNISSVSEAPSMISDVESSIETTTSRLSPLNSVPVTKMEKFQFGLDNTPEESPKESRGHIMRSRTHTLAAIHSRGKKPMERGRRKLKDIKKEEKKQQPQIKRQSSLTNINALGVDYELMSPEIASWIRDKIVRDLQDKYGGRERANKAASKIQRAYREYKLQSRFKEIRREKHRRNRAQSMRAPYRRPSILNKNRPLKYRREKSNPDVVDPVSKALEAARKLSRDRPGHSHSGTRLQLVEEKRKEVQEVCELAELKEDLEATPPIDPSQVMVHIQGVCEDESSDDPKQDKTDGLTSAHSTGDIDKPVSIFSTGSGVSSAQTTSPPLFRAKELNIDTLEQKKNIGVNHFNRKPTKGIQYLVMSDILEDDPRSVAEFLVSPNNLSKRKIGEFLGEINSDFNMAVLECLVEHMDMRDKPIDEALRQFQQIFRMPGEAQKIDKIMEVFALEYYKTNKGALIRSEDAAYMLSFAIMMLHTSLHNPSVRSRITKKQWLSMNRGCNEGDNFSESMMMEIYDRILTYEFTTGSDHTDEVMKIEKQISGLPVTKLADPQRRLLGRFSVHEVIDPNSKSYRAHRRTLFVFRDLLILCKNRNRNEYAYKDHYFLLTLVPVSFDTQYYKYGVQIHSSMEDKIVLQIKCDSHQDRETLLGLLSVAIAELSVMETERIAELGTTLSAKPGQDKLVHGGSVKHTHRITGGSVDLTGGSEGGDQSGFVFGVGDIAVNTTYHHNYLRDPSYPLSPKQNRSSGDSGFDSQQPTPSPSPTEPTRYTPSPDSPSPTHTTYLTPDPSLSSSLTHTTHSHTGTPVPVPPSFTSTTITTVHTTHLTPHSLTPSPAHIYNPNPSLKTPPRSKSSDTLRAMTIIPSSHNRSPSAELIRDDAVDTGSPKKSKKHNPKRDVSKKKSWFGKSSKSSPTGRPESSPAPRRGSMTPPRNHQKVLGLPIGQTRARSSSSVDLTQTS